MKHDQQDLVKCSSIPISNKSLQLLNRRLGSTDIPCYHVNPSSGIDDMSERLLREGGRQQQSRMIKAKRHSLDQATKYSYQAAFVKKCNTDGTYGKLCCALINPDRTKLSYDDKILSIGFEHGFKPGDVFEWHNTQTKWLIYIQELTELAYLRAEIRKCTNEITWEDENGQHKTFVSVKSAGQMTLEEKLAHGIALDVPNNTIVLLLPKNEDTLKQFQRYTKFYMPDADNPINQVCWRVEGVNAFNTPGILELTAVEYYSNTQTDDVENGIVDKYITIIDPNEGTEDEDIILGDTFIKPKQYYIYTTTKTGEYWRVDTKYPIDLEEVNDENNISKVKLIWDASYSGQFELYYGDYTKTIVVESLF